MRGLLNQNIAEFISDNPIGFPPVLRYMGQLEHGYKKAHGNSISGLPKKIGEK